ncbi:MAG: outer membrane beta-barrel domain-containing protein [Deltaproteobacteria bacterium]|nr:outer membrane beta-barrel domain-containing protein [Deltaproteobacteria bacterium]
MYIKNIIKTLIFFSLWGWTGTILGESPSQSTWLDYEIRLKAVYNQKYEHHHRHELSTFSSLYFRNDLNLSYGFGADYAYHFTPTLSWEAAHFLYLNQVETILRQDIRNKTGLIPDVEENEFFVTSSIMFHPAYGKLAFFGRHIAYFDLYVVAGGGIRKLLNLSQLKSAFSFGAGFRCYLSHKLTLKIDARDMLFQEEHQSGASIIHSFTPVLGLSLLL